MQEGKCNVPMTCLHEINYDIIIIWRPHGWEICRFPFVQEPFMKFQGSDSEELELIQEVNFEVWKEVLSLVSWKAPLHCKEVTASPASRGFHEPWRRGHVYIHGRWKKVDIKEMPIPWRGDEVLFPQAIPFLESEPKFFLPLYSRNKLPPPPCIQDLYHKFHALLLCGELSSYPKQVDRNGVLIRFWLQTVVF